MEKTFPALRDGAFRSHTGLTETEKAQPEQVQMEQAQKKFQETEKAALENNYWRTFKELHNDPEFLEATKIEPDTSKTSALSRRKFLGLLSASAALAATGCANYRDKGEVIPYNQKPEEVILGLPNFYASTFTDGSNVSGVLLKTREGRPIKVDGNPDHPVSKGKINARGQASILNLYDPGRYREPMFSPDRQNHQPVQWKDLTSKIAGELKAASSSGKEIAIVTNTISSPTLKKLLEDFKTTYPTTKVYSYEVFNDSNRKSAWQKCYGTRPMPVVQLDKAKVIVALESDFLETEGDSIESTRMFTQNRDVMKSKDFNRLYCVESAMTITSMNADYRLRLRSDAIEEFVFCLLAELSKNKVGTLDPKPSEVFTKKYKLDEKVVKHLVDDLEKNAGSSFVLCGEKLPESTHIAVNMLNEILGNTKLFSSEASHVEVMPLSSQQELENLAANMNTGKVGAVIHFGSNPVYNFSSDYNYAEALKKVQTVITMTESQTETGEASNYILACNHDFESWGDHQTRSNFYGTQQPIINPLYNTRQKESILLSWIQNAGDFTDKIYHEYLKTNWEKNIYPAVGSAASFKNYWNSVLHDGVAPIKLKSETNTAINQEALATTNKVTVGSGFVVLLQNNNSIGDGRFANNGWLQELPHPVSKIVWDNYAAISVQSAAELGVNNNDMIEISVGNKKQTLPVFIQPGLGDKVIEVSLGYGRTKAGVVGSDVGVNAGALQSKAHERFLINASVTKASGTYELVSTQEHFPIDPPPLLKDIQYKRHIIQEGTVDEYKKNPKFIKEHRGELDLRAINRTHDYKNVKWAMSIDLNKCTGCGSCVIACNVENNIPVVGKEQVKANREMMWLRVDRYYSGSADEPKISTQPMLCQHCDFAPCENVCPVAATTHSPDGINGMAYNRCVGTRYCSNNCPYKVRRFNYFNFRDHFKDEYYEQDSLSLLHNPEVTVRSRGVMEKCTFCIQRIMTERQNAIEQKREIKGANVKTACQEACPSEAIIFGNANDKESEIAKYREHELGYTVLEEIKVFPNVTYIAKLRNVSETEHKSEK